MSPKQILAATPLLLGALALGACGDQHAKQIEEGHMVYERVCASCHAVAVGPDLTNVVGRKVGSVAGFDYSEAMKNDKSSWTEDRLKNFLMGPLQMYPEGRMVITPLKPEEADAVIAYLKDRGN